MSEFNLLDLPDLIQHEILTYLNPHTLLKLREVCKTTLNRVNKSRKHISHWEEFQTRIEEKGWKNFETLLKTEFKISSLYICNETVNFYNNPFIPEFLQKYGTHITKLKIRKFFACSFEKELQFFQGLPNLTELELEFSDFKQETLPDEQDFINAFKNLKILKFGDVKLSKSFKAKDIAYWHLICYPNLEFLKHPKIIRDTHDPHHDSYDWLIMPIIFIWLKNTSHLKYYDYDIENIKLENFGVTDNIFQFLFYCQVKGIKLLNVAADLFNHNRFSVDIDCIISIYNFHPNIEHWKLTTLEKLSIKTSLCPAPGTQNKFTFPNLKTLEIDFDSEISKNVDSLICCTERPSVQNLKLNFNSMKQYISNEIIPGRFIPIRNVYIVECFPNLRKLELLGFSKPYSFSFVDLWKGLSDKIEEILLEDCKDLKDQDFIGYYSKHPAFLNLKGLRKLTLSQLDSMPGITDRSFETVFRHMQLKEFRLVSNSPVENITVAGIKSLLNGEFEKSNVKFPFHTWSSAKIPSNEFRELAKQFNRR